MLKGIRSGGPYNHNLLKLALSINLHRRVVINLKETNVKEIHTQMILRCVSIDIYITSFFIVIE